MLNSNVLLIILVAALFWSCTSEGDKAESNRAINTELQKELIQIQQSDQKYREYAGRINSDEAFKDSLIQVWDVKEDNIMMAIWNRQLKVDSVNLVRIEEIIAEHGYPGTSTVGKEASQATWFVLQHAPIEYMEKYHDLIREAAEAGELSKARYAMYVDRMKMYQGKPQIYGSQGQRITLKNGDPLWIIWPLEDPENADSLRKDVGFSDSVTENALRMGIEYKHYTIEELREMTNELPYPKNK